MATEFVDYETKICADWLNAISITVEDVLASAETAGDARTALDVPEEAPQDSGYYVRFNATWDALPHSATTGRDDPAQHPIGAIDGLQGALDDKLAVTAAASTYLPLAGGTVIGHVVSSAGDPTLDTHLAKKGWIDTNFLNLAGGTVTGHVVSSAGDPTLDTHLANKGYVDSALVAAVAAYLVPPGTVAAFAMATPPSGWLLCDGSYVSQAGYPDLYAAIGLTWGFSGPAGTFDLPDLRGLFLRGAGTNGQITAAAAAMASYVEDSFKSHTHDVVPGTNTMMSITAAGAGTFSITPGAPPANVIAGDVTSGATGGSETAPDHAVITYCIKT